MDNRVNERAWAGWRPGEARGASAGDRPDNDTTSAPIQYSRGTTKYDNEPINKYANSFAAFRDAVLKDRGRAKGRQYITSPFKVNGDGKAHRCKEDALPRAFIPFDFDGVTDAETFGELILFLQRYEGFAYTTASHTPQSPRARAILAASRAMNAQEAERVCLAIEALIEAACGAGTIKFDRSVYGLAQPLYCPPVTSETYQFDGAPVDVDSVLLTAPPGTPRGASKVERLDEAQRTDPVARALDDRGMVKSRRADGALNVVCPCASEHSSESGESATIYYMPHTGGFKNGRFVCQHEHCRTRTQDEFLAALGMQPRGGPADAGGDTGQAERDKAKARPAAEGASTGAAPRLGEFLAYLPEHRYIYRPTGDLWPADAVNGAVPWPKVGGKEIKPSTHLDINDHVLQMTWAPGEPELIEGKLAVDGGWVDKKEARVYNLYRPPLTIPGDPAKAQPWLAHLKKVYPDDAVHITHWLAHRVQRPHEKLNHALVIGGEQGVGKDSILEPAIHGVGPWNTSEVTPPQMLGRFNGWVKSVILRVNEARDLGDVDRFAFYDHCKTYITAPPEVLRVDEKNRREYPVLNRCGVILTTNHKLDGIYLPPDDRRHYVAWTDATRDDFKEGYWTELWNWYGAGGIGHVVAYLKSYSLDGFDPKAPPPRTAAFEAIVQSNHAADEMELADLIEAMDTPAVVSLTELLREGRVRGMHELINDMQGSKNARRTPHRMDRVGYNAVKNPATKDGRWKHNDRNTVIYA